MAILFLLDYFLLEVSNMNLNVLLGFFFLLNGIGNFVEELFHAFSIHAVPGLVVLFIVDFSLNREVCTMSSLRD
jgi:hypothetical protein